MSSAAEVARKPLAVRGGPLDAERHRPAQGSGPLLELAVAARVRGRDELVDANTKQIDRYRDMNVLVSINTHDDRSSCVFLSRSH